MKIFSTFLTFVAIVSLGSLQFASAQTTEVSIAFNSGFYAFSSSGSESTTIFNANAAGSGYANNPYGSKPSLSYGLSANLKYIALSSIVLGADLGFEVLRSKINITNVSVSPTTGSTNSPATGKSILNQNFINLYPFVGYRLDAPTISIDFLFGLDLGYCTDSKEKDDAMIAGGATYYGTYDRNLKDFDVRPRAQVGVNYQKFGVYAGYAIGLINYQEGLLGSNNSARASIIRFGVSYRLK